MKLTNTQGFLGKLDAGEMIKANGEYGALEQVSAQLETQFLQSLLKQMRSASDALADEDSVFSSQNDGMYRDWYDTELASHLSQAQSIGLAEVMTKQLAVGLKTPPETAALEMNSLNGQLSVDSIADDTLPFDTQIEHCPVAPFTSAMQPALITPKMAKDIS